MDLSSLVFSLKHSLEGGVCVLLRGGTWLFLACVGAQ